MKPTETNRCLPLKNEGFANLVEALEYAADGETGYNFYNGRGELYAVLSYRELRDDAQVLARGLLGLGCERGARVGIIAETHPMFHRFFYACQYAGFIPVALPSSVQIGAHKALLSQPFERKGFASVRLASLDRIPENRQRALMVPLRRKLEAG